MKYRPAEEEQDLFWFAINYRTAGLHSAQGEWIALEAYFDKQLQAAFDAGRASRDAEVEALQADLTTHRELMVRQLAGNQALRDEVEALKADAERYRWLRAGNYPIDFAKSVLNDTPFGIDQAIDAARKEK